MPRLPRSHGAWLTLGSVAASALNFYSFVLLPSWTGMQGLDAFARDNYLGGLYLAAVASSVAPIGIFILSAGHGQSLRRYAGMSALGLLATLSFGWPLLTGPWAAACIAGALLMHLAGFLLSGLIYNGRLRAASACQIVQPAIFACLLSVSSVGASWATRWALCYLISTASCVACFAACTPWRLLISGLATPPQLDARWRDLLIRMVLCVSFSLFFQLELVLAGQLTPVGLGEYSVLQKLYSSIATSMFGSLGVLLLAKQRQGTVLKIFSKISCQIALAAAGVVVVVGTVLYFQNRQGHLTPSLIGEAAVIAFAFTLSSFANLQMQAWHPARSMTGLLTALAAYALGFHWVQPANAISLMALAGLFFSTYLISSWALLRRRPMA